MSIKIAIADDHQLITEGLQHMLRYSADMEVVATYANGEELLQHIGTIQPDVLLLDINMPGRQGDELARIITRDFPRIRIIALTNLDNIYYIKSMLQQGVAGYVLKNARRDVLTEAIKRVSGGNEYFDETVKERIAEEKESIRRQTAHGSVLTRREKEVLQLIAENNTSKEIADKLCLSKRTIDHHRESILSKLEVKNVSALVKKAIELGLISL
ncbi:response regulator [Chitinophagaceae bacterium MMS25-I14]